MDNIASCPILIIFIFASPFLACCIKLLYFYQSFSEKATATKCPASDAEKLCCIPKATQLAVVEALYQGNKQHSCTSPVYCDYCNTLYLYSNKISTTVYCIYTLIIWIKCSVYSSVKDQLLRQYIFISVQVKPLLQVTRQDEEIQAREAQLQKAKDNLNKVEHDYIELERKHQQVHLAITVCFTPPCPSCCSNDS